MIKADGIGDAVLASPFFYELRRLYPDAEITAVLSPLGAPVLSGLGIIDKPVIFDAGWLKYSKTPAVNRWLSAAALVVKINSLKPDILIALRWQDRLSSLVLSLSSAKEKYGYDVRGMGFGINHKAVPAPGTPEYLKHFNILRLMNLAAKVKVKFGVSVSKEAQKTAKNAVKGLKKGYIVLQPVSGHPSKDWERSKFRALCYKIAANHPVFIIGSASDRGIERFDGKNVYNMAGKLSVEETAALIKNAELFIGNDSFGGHMAAAFGVKSITLFSGTAPAAEWAPYGKKAQVMVSKAECAPCKKTECDQEMHKCMDFSVKEVYERVLKVLK